MADNQVVVEVTQEDLYDFFLFAVDLVEGYLRMGTRIGVAEMNRKLMTLYALKEASLRIQPGEMLQPPYQGKHEKKGIAVNYDDRTPMPTEATC